MKITITFGSLFPRNAAMEPCTAWNTRNFPQTNDDTGVLVSRCCTMIGHLPKQNKVLQFFQVMSILSPALLLLLIDLGPEIQDPGWIKIRIQNPQHWFLLFYIDNFLPQIPEFVSSVVDPGCLSQIPGPTFFRPGSRITNPNSFRPGSRIRIK